MAAKASAKLVGLDIGTSGIRAVQLSVNRRTGRYRIAKAASVDLPRDAVRNGSILEPDVVASALKKLWRKGHFSTRKVAFSLADSGVLTRQLELPWMPPDDFRAALRYQIGDALPVDLATVELDYHLLGEVSKKDEHGQPVDLNRILIVATSTDTVTAEASTLRHARLEPVVADSAAFALIRAACQGTMPADDSTHAIADIGADQLTVVVHQGGQPRFIRTISNLGGDTATNAVAAKLGIDIESAEEVKRETGLNGPPPDVAPIAESTVFGGLAGPSRGAVDPRVSATVDALNPWATTVVSEVRNSLDYFQASDPGASISTLTVAGRTALLQGLVERIATQIPLPVHAMEPLAGLDAPKRLASGTEPDSRLAVAIGLAMGAAE
jgi:type IV pilus assembly protein PilM